MKRNERITSSWGFLTQGAKTMMCLLVLMLSVQAVLAAEPKQFIVNGFTYAIDKETGTAVFTGNMFDKCGLDGKEVEKLKYSDKNPYPEVIVVPDYVYCESTGQTLPVTKVGNGACKGGGKIFRNTKRIIIGDNVTEIEDGAFTEFGKRDAADHMGPVELILGKHVTRIAENAFAKFGETGDIYKESEKGDKNTAQFKVYIQTDYRPYSKSEKDGLQLKLFKNVKGVTFYVKNEDVYQTFITPQDEDKGKENNWPNFDENSDKNIKEKRRNSYNYDGFEIVGLKAGRWQTAVFPEAIDKDQVSTVFGNGTLMAVMSEANPSCVNGENGNYLVRFNETLSAKANQPILIKPASENDVYYIGKKSYGVANYAGNPAVVAYDRENDLSIRMIGICDDDHLLTDGQIYFRNYGDGNMKFFMYKEGVGSKVMVKRGKCIWEIVDGSGNVVTNKALDYKIDDAATAIEDVTRKPAAQDGRIYSLTGQYEGTSLENLPKGIHIMNGRKFVVK